ncbi:hypothetical protein JB92DRAFT_1784362 [Gautieria morchelliformis]|nr:hypothetical protein JB92DRAFT_1784362 [Gautieria morchelliformis]
MERGTNKNVSPKFWCGFLVSTSSERRTVSDAENDVYPESSTIQSVEDALASDLARFWSLDTLIQWLTVIRDGSDIHPIPVLKGCVAVMLDIAQNVKLARAYRGDCWSLMHKLDKLMRLTVLAPQNLPVLSKSPAQTILEETHMALKEIELFVAGLAKRRSSFKRFVLASADKAEITKYESKIEEIRKDFHVCSSLSLLVLPCNKINRLEPLCY